MSAAKHTKGPWSQVPQTNGSTLIAHEFETGKQMNPNLRLVCFTMARGNSLPENEANARLIAAAPDLLEALQVQALSDLLPSDEFMRTQGKEPGPGLVMMRAAIAKATGSAS
jgi:hypothetical protein